MLHVLLPSLLPKPALQTHSWTDEIGVPVGACVPAGQALEG